MHSSRMHWPSRPSRAGMGQLGVRPGAVCVGGCLPGGCLPDGCVCLGGVPSLGSVQGCLLDPPVYRMTDVCENITFPQLLLRTVIIPIVPKEATYCLMRFALSEAGVDAGFPVGGGANPPERGANLRYCQKFPKNCMKLRKFWAVGGVPLRSTTEMESMDVLYF